MNNWENTAVIKFKRVHPNATIPKQAHAGDAGFDVTSIETVNVNPSESKLIKTGLVADIPQGYEIEVRPRSGLALKYGITVLNTPGTIDCRYRGEIGVILINHGKHGFEVKQGMRIAQLVVNKLPDVIIKEVASVSTSERGDGGFGSTGE